MLGDKLGDFHGKVIGQRVLPSEEGGSMETTSQFSGELAGVETNTYVTYISTMRPDGKVMGNGHGIVMAADGGGATFVAHGVGTFTGGAGVSFRGSAIYTASGSLAAIDGVVGVFEYEVAEDGETVTGSVWEWK